MARGKAPDFGAFWDAYALKRDRLAAERVWQRLSARDRRAAVDGIPAYRESCRRQGIAMMYGQGYLSHRRWEDPAAERQPAGRRRPGGEPLPDPEAFDDMETW